MQQPLDLDRFRRWAAYALPHLGSDPLKMERLSGGSSSAVYRVSCGAGSVVLRLPAWPPRVDSLKAMGRESRVLSALRGTRVPHPQLLAFAADEAIAGVPFMVMAFIDGWIGTQPPAPFNQPGPHRRAMAFALIDAIATISAVDYRAVGLGDFGKPERFLERQVDRWLAHLESYKVTEGYPGRDIPGHDYVAAWLRANQPQTQRVSLLHSDASFPNVMFAPEPPARVAAIIDWEIATLGDPLLDLGRAVYALPGRRVGTGRNGMEDFSDLPVREELAEHYARLTGLDVLALDYYVVLAAFKLACIIEFNYARMVTGRDTSALARQISDYVLELIADAAAVARAAG